MDIEDLAADVIYDDHSARKAAFRDAVLLPQVGRGRSALSLLQKRASRQVAEEGEVDASGNRERDVQSSTVPGTQVRRLCSIFLKAVVIMDFVPRQLTDKLVMWVR